MPREAAAVILHDSIRRDPNLLEKTFDNSEAQLVTIRNDDRSRIVSLYGIVIWPVILAQGPEDRLCVHILARFHCFCSDYTEGRRFEPRDFDRPALCSIGQNQIGEA